VAKAFIKEMKKFIIEIYTNKITADKKFLNKNLSDLKNAISGFLFFTII